MTFSLSTSDGKSGPQRWRLDLHHLYFLLAALQVLAVGGMIWFGNEAMNSEQATAKLAESWGNCTTEVIHMAELAAAANAPGNDVFESHDISREKLRLDKALVAFRDLMQSVTNRLADDTRVAETPIFEFRLGQIEKRISGIETYGKRVFAALADGDDESAGANMAEMDQQFAAVLPEVTRLCQELREDQQRAYGTYDLCRIVETNPGFSDDREPNVVGRVGMVWIQADAWRRSCQPEQGSFLGDRRVERRRDYRSIS